MTPRTREPFSMEENLELKYYDFASYSILNQLAPQQDDGVTVRGQNEGGGLVYAAGLYKDTGAGRLRDDEDFAGRVVVHPFLGHHTLDGLQFGASTTIARIDHAIGGEALITEAQVPFARFEPGSSVSGNRFRLGAEAAFVEGPFALFAEIMQMQDDVQGVSGSGEVRYDGFYLGGSWVVTGEPKSLDSAIQPMRPTLGGQTPLLSSGAWQLALRYSQLNLDQALVTTGLLHPDSFADDVSTLDLGVNWYATRHLSVKLHLIHTEYGTAIEFGNGIGDADIDSSRDSEDAILLQLQMQF
jgi:phosphate-selective porin